MRTCYNRWAPLGAILLSEDINASENNPGLLEKRQDWLA